MHSVRVAFGDAPASGFLPCISIGLMGLGNSASQCHRHPNWAGFHGDRRLPGMPLDARFNMAGLVSSAPNKVSADRMVLPGFRTRQPLPAAHRALVEANDNRDLIHRKMR